MKLKEIYSALAGQPIELKLKQEGAGTVISIVGNEKGTYANVQLDSGELEKFNVHDFKMKNEEFEELRGILELFSKGV